MLFWNAFNCLLLELCSGDWRPHRLKDNWKLLNCHLLWWTGQLKLPSELNKSKECGQVEGGKVLPYSCWLGGLCDCLSWSRCIRKFYVFCGEIQHRKGMEDDAALRTSPRMQSSSLLASCCVESICFWRVFDRPQANWFYKRIQHRLGQMEDIECEVAWNGVHRVRCAWLIKLYNIVRRSNEKDVPIWSRSQQKGWEPSTKEHITVWEQLQRTLLQGLVHSQGRSGAHLRLVRELLVL